MNATRRLLVPLVLTTSAAALGGCQLLWAVLEKTFPQQRVPAVFDLPGGRKVLVFPDDMLRPVSYPPIKRALAEKVNQLLIRHKLAAETVPYDRLIDLQGAEPDFNSLAIGTVGRKLGAQLVIFVAIDRFSLKETPISTMWQGEFAAKVRVVDVRRGKGRLWPDDPAGYALKVSKRATENPSETYGQELSAELANDLGEKIAGLFRAHRVDRAKRAAARDPFE